MGSALDDDGRLDALIEAFRSKFGREPGPGDPLIFDPDWDEPRPLSVVQIENEMIRIVQLILPVTMSHRRCRVRSR